MKPFLLVLGSTTLLIACGSKDERPPIADVVFTGGSTSIFVAGGQTHTSTKTNVGGATNVAGATHTGGVIGEGGFGGIGGTGVDGGTEPDGGTDLAPVVKLTNPTKDLSTPDEDGVIVDSTFDATCIAQPASTAATAAINKTSVKIELLDAQGNAVAPSVQTQQSSNANEYTARFTLTNATVQAGRVTFRCTASDQDVPPHTSQASIKTYVDYGPDITFASPSKDGEAYALGEAVSYKFTVTPHALDTTDSKAAVGDVTLRVYDAIIPTTVDAQGQYSAQVNFNDDKLFASGLSGSIGATVTATNRRTPKPAASVKPVHIILDGSAPTLAFVDPTPKDNEVIGGSRKICFTAIDNTDGSGVDENTIAVKLNTTVYKYGQPIATAWTKPAAQSYCYTFNSTDFPNSTFQVMIAVSATDYSNNVAPLLTRLLYLDNVPPFVSLDPPAMRIVTRSATSTSCSVPFDPVGPDALNTGATTALPRFRAFVWEQTNHVEGQKINYYSGVDQSNVHIYLRPIADASSPVPVETNAHPDDSNLCDEIADDLKSSVSSGQTQLAPLLSSVSSQGIPDYTGTDFTSPPDVSSFGCVQGSTVPTPLCGHRISDMSYITLMNFAGATPSDLQAIFAVQPSSDPQSLTCTGSQLDVFGAYGIADGWVCAVAEAVDRVGNIGVSAPLPFCLDHSNGGKDGPAPACAISSAPVPNCAIGCNPPSRSLWGDRAVDKVDPTKTAVVRYDTGAPIPFYLEYQQ